MTIRSVVNISDGKDMLEEWQTFEVCPAIDDIVILTKREIKGGSHTVSGKVTRVQHHGVPEDSDEKPYVGIWATTDYV